MEQPENSRGATMLFGAIAAAAGVYFILGGAGVVAPPDSDGAPGWIGVLAGLVFLCGGIAVATQAFGRADEQGELPADAPAWMRSFSTWARSRSSAAWRRSAPGLHSPAPPIASA